MPGKIWRSEHNGTISCMVSSGKNTVRTETRRLQVVPAGEKQWMPMEWRNALWEYVRAFPHSGCGLGPFLAITRKERCDFIRKMAAQLAESDNTGCLPIANSVGEFAAWGYELAEK
jgi:CO dehydrogenase/acetyl-CoA synthase delta subunit